MGFGSWFRDNILARVPGNRTAFPREANGTINWVGNPLSGDNVLGAAARDIATGGLSTAYGGLMGDDDSLDFGFGSQGPSTGGVGIAGNFARDRGRISARAAGDGKPLQGSVVGQGYIGRRSDLGPTARTPGRRPGMPGDSIGLPGPRAPWQMPGTSGAVPVQGLPGSASRAATNAQNEQVVAQARGTGGASSTANWLGARPGGGSAAARGLMGQQLGSLVSFMEANDAIRSRGGTEIER